MILRPPGLKSGDGGMVLEVLDKGLIDVAVVYGGVDSAKYERLPRPAADCWGVLLRRDHPLAAKESIRPEDLWEEPLIFSRQILKKDSHADVVRRWLKKPILIIHKLV